MSDKFSVEELLVYSRQIALREIGYVGQEQLKKARICIMGVGGVGAPTATLLAGMGVGYLRLVDRDIVSRSDLHRQHLYDTDHLEYPKVEVAEERLHSLNPLIEIEGLTTTLTQETAGELIDDVDLVVDGLDNISSRFELGRACVRKKVPYVYAAGIEVVGLVTTVIPGKTACIECSFGGDIPDDALPRCATSGVHPAMLAMVSGIAVSEVVRWITGEEPILKDTLMYVSLDRLELERIKVSRVAHCLSCGETALAQPSSRTQKYVHPSCARDGRTIVSIAPKAKLELDMALVQTAGEEKGYSVELRSRKSVTFLVGSVDRLSILESGSGIGQMESWEDNAEKAIVSCYRSILLAAGVSSDVLP